MGYITGKALLPGDLLAAVQKYVDGQYVYIPRRPSAKRSWGASTGSRQLIRARNEEIQKKHAFGITAAQLADEYCLSVKTVYGILAKREL